MSQATNIVDLYIQSWNFSDSERRHARIEQLYTEDAVYVDPMVEAKGRESINSTITAVQAMFPQHIFSLAGDIDAHHDIARFQWHLTAPGDSQPIAIGFDVVTLAAGRIKHVLGFLDKAPQLA